MEFHSFVWPAEFMCPISRSVMADPVIVSSGQTYERRCIESWLDLGQTRCVTHNTPLNLDFIIPNIAVRDAIVKLAMSKGMQAPPSPPSLSHARALAKHFISELQASNHTTQTSDFSGKDARYSSNEGLVKSFGRLEIEEEGDDIHRIGTIDIRDEQGWESQSSSSSSCSLDYPQRNIATRGDMDIQHRQSDKPKGLRVFREQRAASHDVYSRYARATIGGTDQAHRQSDEGFRVSGELRAGPHDGYSRYTAATRGDTNLLHGLSDNVEAIRFSREQRASSHDGYSRYTQPDGSHDSYKRHTRADGYGSSPTPMRYSHSASAEVLLETSHGRGEVPPHRSSPTSMRYSHSAVGEALLETSHGRGELPLHLVTEPSSYFSTEASSSPVKPSSISSTITSLIEKLQDPMPESQEAAVIELRQLTRMSAENRASLCCPDLIHALLPHLKSQSSIVQINAVTALVNFSLEKQNKVMIVRSGAVPFLVEVLKRGFPESQEQAAGAVFSLAIADENKDPIGVLNAIPPLLHLLQLGPLGCRKDAAMALYQLSLFQTNRIKLVRVGAVPFLLNLAESEEMPDLASSALLILCNVAAIPEGRLALLEHNAITRLVDLLAVRSNKYVPEHAAATLLLLSKGNRRFKTMASHAGAQELLTAVADIGTPRAREKALAVLAIMKESSSGPDDSETDSMLSRQYPRRNKGRLDGIHMNSSAF